MTAIYFNAGFRSEHQMGQFQPRVPTNAQNLKQGFFTPPSMNNFFNVVDKGRLNENIFESVKKITN